MTWDARYRQLEKDEAIEFADEYDASPDSWRDPPRWTRVKAFMIGTRAPDPQFIAHTTFRRRLSVEEAKRLIRALDSGCWRGLTEVTRFPLRLFNRPPFAGSANSYMRLRENGCQFRYESTSWSIN